MSTRTAAEVPRPGAAEVRVRVNGSERVVPAGLTVRGLLEHLDLVPETIVVEHNQEILDRKRYGEVPVEAGDLLELVHFVGGG